MKIGRMKEKYHSNPQNGQNTVIQQTKEIIDYDAPPYTRELNNNERNRLDSLYNDLIQANKTYTGYPCNLLFDYSELYRFLQFSINNVGDIFQESNFKINTHTFEREMIDVFAELTGAEPGNYWGYINHGGTEGNMYGLYLAREMTADRGIVYFSEDTHYSVSKIVRVLKTRYIMIKSAENGEMDYEDLRETIRFHRDSPPIIMANIGTTMTGAVDNLKIIHSILNEFAITNFYIHCDAALSGLILPFVDNPQPFGFSAGIDSISISGHKMIGCPFPCGILLTKKKYVDQIARGVEYIGALDTTLSGSRNALGPLILWYAFKRYGKTGLKNLIQESIARADYTIDRFKKNGINAWRNENSITVVFPRPFEKTVWKWQLAPKGNISHIITLPHLKRDAIDTIADEVAADLEQMKQKK